ncbi:MAG TPA: GAF domain-containing sensor histidine kinase [Gemmatimonadaceae bacterium]|nr:GAF domain-containing sensor histidine kinase [Gemmatimonadaceae bacterium]
MIPNSSDESSSLDGALDSLDTGVLMLSHELRVTYANARWAAWRGVPIPNGAPLASLVELAAGESLLELKATLADGEPRTLHFVLRPAHGDAPSRYIVCAVRRVGAGLVLEARAETDVELLPLYDVARRLAEVVDMAEVLRTLCDIASRQCHGTGAAVLRMTGKLGEVVAAVGNVVPARGRCFELRGSLMAEALELGELVSEENFSGSGRPLMRAVPELTLGPILVAPLRAHGEMLGVLAVTRTAGSRPFHERERDRLKVLADHAALAVHKSLLLQQAQSADRAKGRFLATMSHELRTPLTALAGYGELLADQVIGPMSEPQLDILERMRSVTNHLSAMIEEILAFSSLEEGRETVRPSEFLAEDLVRSALAAVEPMAEQKRIVLNQRLGTSSVRVTSDIDKARQILVNLLGNAIKFTDKGSVTVRLRKASTSVRLEVQDTGIGIPPEELPRLFRPFAQVDTGLTRRHGGTGLGLYISRRLATLLGGHIEVSSEPGVGSTFTVVLPLEWAGLERR